MLDKLTSSPSRYWQFETANLEGEGADGPIHLLLEFARRAWRNKYRVAACFCLGLIAATFYARSLPPTYSATASLLLEPRQTAVLGDDANSQQSLDPNRADSEVQIITSERLLSAVFTSLSLGETRDLASGPPSLGQSLYANMAQFFNRFDASSRKAVDDRADLRSTLIETESARQAAFARFEKKIAVRRVGQSYVIEISYSSSNPFLPARVANAAVSAYIMQGVSFKAEAVRARGEALQGRLDALAAQVNASKDAMQRGTLPNIPTPDADVRVIGAALPPLAPSGPRVALYALLGGVLGILTATAGIAASLVAGSTIFSVEDLSRQAHLPCFGQLEDLGDEKTPIATLPKIAGAVRDMKSSIETACQLHHSERGPMVAFVSWSSDDHVGRLAFRYADLLSCGHQVVTLFRPQLLDDTEEDDFGNGGPARSLADIALSASSHGSVAPRPPGSLEIVPILSSDSRTNMVADFRGPQVAQFIEAIRHGGTSVMELPDLNVSRDALPLASYADVLVFVAISGKTTSKQIRTSMQLLKAAQLAVSGTILVRS